MNNSNRSIGYLCILHSREHCGLSKLHNSASGTNTRPATQHCGDVFSKDLITLGPEDIPCIFYRLLPILIKAQQRDEGSAILTSEEGAALAYCYLSPTTYQNLE